MSDPLAYLITCRAYGTWLHGDARGSVDREHNVYGTKMQAPNRLLQSAERNSLKTAPVIFSEKERKVIADTIRSVCYRRGWSLAALNVRTTHLHAVVSAPDLPERVMHAFKAYVTRGLRALGTRERDARVWARHGSTRYLWKPDQVESACRYVAESQGQDLGGEF